MRTVNRQNDEIADEEEAETEETVVEEAETIASIAPLTDDFGREDLNLMRDKINEVIAR